MKYISTRNKNIAVSGAEAIVKGLSGDGGLFVPQTFPSVGADGLKRLLDLDYPQLSAEIIGLFLPSLKGRLDAFCTSAYRRFEGNAAPLVKTADKLYMLELWHGPTHAFKDIALTLLPHLLRASKEETGETDETLILVATSGDTGKAALEGFKNQEGIKVLVFYPEEGVSNLQKLQMKTAAGNNVSAVAVKGNFDDAQTAVKAVFADAAFADALQAKGVKLSSANSMNFGRLVPQIAYYFSAYCDLVVGEQIALGDKVNFCVPTGNFGNILAGYYARRMGLPINKLICASNRNNVLTDFFNTGAYVSKREFFKTTSPSMDILISSNLERLLFEVSGRDDEAVKARMAALKTGEYSITEKEKAELRQVFWAGYADEEAAADAVFYNFEEYGYVADPHTAVALCVNAAYASATGDKTPTVVLSTASPYKFPSAVLAAMGETPSADETANLSILEELTALPVPETLLELPSLPVLHGKTVEKTGVKQAVADFAGVKI